MNRTKEIDVWVDKSEIDKCLPGNTDSFAVYTEKCGEPMYQAKLIITLPERKVEITESQFEDAYNYAHTVSHTKHEMIVNIKEKLFGKEQA